MRPERRKTAEALLREHFSRVEKESECEFGPIEFAAKNWGPGLKVLSAFAAVKKDFKRPSTTCSEVEMELMESMWSTLH